MQAHPAVPYMEVWVSGKYFVVFYKGLKHPQIFLSEGGFWNQSPMDAERWLYTRAWNILYARIESPQNKTKAHNNGCTSKEPNSQLKELLEANWNNLSNQIDKAVLAYNPKYKTNIYEPPVVEINNWVMKKCVEWQLSHAEEFQTVYANALNSMKWNITPHSLSMNDFF